MSKIYSNTNKGNGNRVTLYHNTVDNHYEVIVLGHHVRHYVGLDKATANRIYNEELIS